MNNNNDEEKPPIAVINEKEELVAVPPPNDDKDVENRIEEAGRVEPPDGGYGWVVVVASFLVNMAVDGIIYTSGSILIPYWTKRFGSASAASSAISILTGSYYVCGPLASALVNVFGIRSVAFGGGILSTSAFVMAKFATELWQIYLLFGLIAGVGFGCMYFSSIVVLSVYFQKKRSAATGFAVCGSGIGNFAYAMLNPVVFEMLGSDANTFMLYLAAIACTGALWSLFFAPLTASDSQVEKVATIVKKYEGTEVGAGEEATRKLLDAVRNDLEEMNKPGHQADTMYTGNAPCTRSRINSMDKKERPHVVHVTEKHTIEHVVKKSKLTEFKESLLSIWDKELLFSPSFMTLSIAGTLTVLSFLVTFSFLSDIIVEKNPEMKPHAMIPLSLIGIFNIAGRLLCGIIANHPKVSALQVSNIATIVAGTSMLFVPFCTELWHYVAFCIPFSAGVACFAALRSVICVELVGVEKLTNAFGIMMVFMGIGALVGGPIAATLRDITGSYDISFYVMGVVFAFSGIMTIRLPQMKQWEEERRQRRASGGTEMGVIASST